MNENTVLFFGQAIEEPQFKSQKQIKKQTKTFCVERNEMS